MASESLQESSKQISGPSISDQSSSHPKHNHPSSSIHIPPLSLSQPQKPIPKWSLRLSLKATSKSVSSVSFSPDSNKLAIASSDSSIDVYSFLLPSSIPESVIVPQLDHLLRLSGHTAGVNDLAWSPDSAQLASAADDHSVRVWTISGRPRPPRKLLGHSHCVYCLAFHPLGTMLISGSFDETIRLWDAAGRKLIRSFPGHSEVVSALDFSHDGSVIVSASFDGLT